MERPSKALVSGLTSDTEPDYRRRVSLFRLPRSDDEPKHSATKESMRSGSEVSGPEVEPPSDVKTADGRVSITNGTVELHFRSRIYSSKAKRRDSPTVFRVEDIEAAEISPAKGLGAGWLRFTNRGQTARTTPFNPGEDPLTIQFDRTEMQAVEALATALVEDLGLTLTVVDAKAERATQKDKVRASQASERASAAADQQLALDDILRDAETFGTKPSKKALAAILDHAGVDESPWLIMGGGAGGVLAAFEDRLLIIKTGGLTSMVAGTFGGGRFTTFMYSDITGIEYNSGMVNGVLEVLTPSYQGSANKDFWKGTGSGRNDDSNDPFTLSNTLPWSKSLYQASTQQITELRRRIAEAKRPQVAQQAAGSGSSLGAQIKELAELHADGVLSDVEFEAAKARLIAGS